MATVEGVVFRAYSPCSRVPKNTRHISIGESTESRA